MALPAPRAHARVRSPVASLALLLAACTSPLPEALRRDAPRDVGSTRRANGLLELRFGERADSLPCSDGAFACTLEDLWLDPHSGRIVLAVLRPPQRGGEERRIGVPFSMLELRPGEDALALGLASADVALWPSLEADAVAGLVPIPPDSAEVAEIAEAVERPAGIEASFVGEDPERTASALASAFENQSPRTLGGGVVQRVDWSGATEGEPLTVVTLRDAGNLYHRVLLAPDAYLAENGFGDLESTDIAVEAVPTRDERGLLWLAASISTPTRKLVLRSPEGQPAWWPSEDGPAEGEATGDAAPEAPAETETEAAAPVEAGAAAAQAAPTEGEREPEQREARRALVSASSLLGASLFAEGFELGSIERLLIVPESEALSHLVVARDLVRLGTDRLAALPWRPIRPRGADAPGEWRFVRDRGKWVDVDALPPAATLELERPLPSAPAPAPERE